MRIDYQILWMENDTDWLEPKIDDIKEYLNDLGFELKLTNIAKYEDKNFSDYDIIVVDFNLDNESGTDAIEKIIKNRKNIFTDILFILLMVNQNYEKKWLIKISMGFIVQIEGTV